MKTHELEAIAQALVPAGKGILAADEGDATIKRRFDSINVECTEANRRAYREMLFTTPGTEEFISGVILFEEDPPSDNARWHPLSRTACEQRHHIRYQG